MMKNLLTLFTILAFANFSFAQFDSLGIIGSATAQGWDAQTNMANPATDEWTINIDLTNGAAKFRTDNTWLTNWGSADFPTGTGTQGGDDIPIWGGNFDVTFNSATGAYNFDFQDSIYAQVGLIGEAGIDWSTDIFLTPIPNAPWAFSDVLELKAGECKFRADGVWMDEWADGGDGLAGVAATSGGGNFVIPSDGEYLVEINTATGEYKIESFIKIYETMGVIGAGSPTGTWDTEMAMSNINGNVHQWAITGDFDGEFKFRGDSSWDTNFGADGTQNFPLDTAVFSSSNNIVAAPAGTYLLEFNDTSGIYEFKDPIVDYATIGVIGSAVGGWDDDIDMFKNPSVTAPDEWLLTITITDGELKFRADDDWANNWGDPAFPTGVGTPGGDNIQVFAGTWIIAFNSSTGAYSFTPASVGTIGPGSPTGGWDDDENLDAAVDHTTPGLWTGTQNLTAGELKFRQNDDWAVNWGGADFPMGASNQDGVNINIADAGFYAISLQTTNPFAMPDEYNGDYSFAITISNDNLFTVNDVKIIPNPATDLVTVKIDNAELTGDAEVMIYDMTGKLMRTGTYQSTNNISFNVSNFPTGFYVIQMRGEGFLISKRFAVAK